MYAGSKYKRAYRAVAQAAWRKLPSELQILFATFSDEA